MLANSILAARRSGRMKLITPVAGTDILTYLTVGQMDAISLRALQRIQMFGQHNVRQPGNSDQL